MTSNIEELEKAFQQADMQVNAAQVRRSLIMDDLNKAYTIQEFGNIFNKPYYHINNESSCTIFIFTKAAMTPFVGHSEYFVFEGLEIVCQTENLDSISIHRIICTYEDKEDFDINNSLIQFDSKVSKDEEMLIQKIEAIRNIVYTLKDIEFPKTSGVSENKF